MCFFSTGLNTYDLTFKNPYDIYSSVVSLIWAGLLIVFIGLIALFSIGDLSGLRSKRLEVLLQEIKDTKGSRLFYIFHITRRVILSNLIINFRSSGLIQLSSFIVVCITQFAYMGIARPFQESLTNFQEITYEVIIIFIIGLFAFFMFPKTEQATNGLPAAVGWVGIALVVSTIFIHYFVMFVNIGIKACTSKTQNKVAAESKVHISNISMIKYMNTEISTPQSINLQLQNMKVNASVPRILEEHKENRAYKPWPVVKKYPRTLENEDR